MRAISAFPAVKARTHGPVFDPHRQLEILVGAGMSLLTALDVLGGHVLSWRAERRISAAAKNRISAGTAVVMAGGAALVVLFAWGAAGNVSGENAWLTAGPAGAAATSPAALAPASTSASAAVTTAARSATSPSHVTRKADLTMTTHTARKLLLAGGTAAATLAGATALAAPAGAAVPATHHASAVVHKTLVISTPAGNGKAGWPLFVNSKDIVLPKNSTVELTIRSSDDGAASLPANVIFYDKVMGTVGTKETVNGKTVKDVSNKVISHTFTIPTLGINLPVPAAATGKSVVVTATIHTGKAGTYSWQCYAPCGSGKGDEHGAMDGAGYMKGLVTIR